LNASDKMMGRSDGEITNRRFENFLSNYNYIALFVKNNVQR